MMLYLIANVVQINFENYLITPSLQKDSIKKRSKIQSGYIPCTYIPKYYGNLKFVRTIFLSRPFMESSLEKRRQFGKI